MDTHKNEYSTPKQQIEKLKAQGLIINDENYAASVLSCYGYSNLIKSYREPYIFHDNGKLRYRSGVTFEQIASIYELDKNIRNSVMASMQDLEEHFKELAANVVAHSFGTNQDDYLRFRNYQNKRKSIEKFKLGSILDSLKSQLETPKDPIHYYYNTYGIVPPWILFKSVYFSTMVNFIDQFKTPEHTELMHLLMNYEDLGLSESSARMLMMDILFVCMEYRNNAAHGGRMYNFIPRNKIRAASIFGSDSVDFNPAYTCLILLLGTLRYKTPCEQLDLALTTEINRHCMLFPQDVTYLGKLLKINIEVHQYVYLSPISNKYHTDPNCSGLKNAIQAERSLAINNGYTPCKKCCNAE